MFEFALIAAYIWQMMEDARELAFALMRAEDDGWHA
jgi:hypothetical protein